MSQETGIAEELGQQEHSLNLLLEEAAALVRQGEPGSALARYAEVREIAPEKLQGWYNPALILFQAGKLQDALPFLERAVTIAPNMAETSGLLGISLFNLGQLPQAFPYLQKAQMLKPEWQELNYYRGVCMCRQGQLKDAKPLLENAVQFRPDWVEAQAQLGMACVDLKQPQKAEIHLREALRLRPAWMQLIFPLAAALIANGKHEEGIEQLRKLVNAQPDFAEAHMKLGQALRTNDEITQAEVHLQHAATLKPQDPAFLAPLAKLYLEQQQYDKAEPLLERIVSLKPDWTKMKADLEAIRQMKTRQQDGKQSKAAPWPTSTRFFRDLDTTIERFVLPGVVYPETPLIREGARVFTFGSCFAHNLADALKRYPLDVDYCSFNEEANSSYANRYLFDWITQGATNDITRHMQEFFGERGSEELRNSISQADLLIMTVGVAPCFFDRDSGEFAFLTGGSTANFDYYASKYAFRTTTVAENVGNMQHVLARIREINANAPVVLSLSPVPLRGTFEMGSAVMADCLSKSTLRVAVEELLRHHQPQGNLFYWPSFEMTKWLGAHMEQSLYGGHDNNSRHVSRAVVDRVIAAFLRVYGEEGLAEREI